MLRVGVLVSGGGTNLQAILDAIDAGKITNAEIAAGDQQQSGRICPGAGEEAWCRGSVHFPEGLSRAEMRSTRHFWQRWMNIDLDLIVLAGFLVKIPAAMIAEIRE